MTCKLPVYCLVISRSVYERHEVSISDSDCMYAMQHVPTEKKKPADLTLEKREGGIRYTNSEGKSCFINRAKRSNKQRKNRVAQKKASVLAALAGDEGEEEEDEE